MFCLFLWEEIILLVLFVFKLSLIDLVMSSIFIVKSLYFRPYRGLTLKMENLPDARWNDGDGNFEAKKLLRCMYI